MGRIFIRLLLLVAVVAGVAWLARAAGYWGKPPETAAKIYGNVEVREAELAFRVAGRINQLLVDEGDRVEPGTLLAQLETRPFEDAVANASADIGVVSATLNRQQNGNRPQDIAQAQAGVREATAMRDEAQRQYHRRRDLLAKGFIPAADVDAAEAGLASAEAKLTAAEQALSLQQAGTRRDEIAETRATSGAAEARRRQAITSLSDTALVAPSRGIISTRVREAGTIVQAGETVFTLALDDPLRVRAFVPGPLLSRVKPGDRVTVYADAASRRYAGVIANVAPNAEFTPKTVETEGQRADFVYRVRITITDPDGGLRQGQPVTVLLPNRK